MGSQDLIIGSWCGEKFRPERVMARAGFGQTPAMRHQDLYEIKIVVDFAAWPRGSDRWPRGASKDHWAVGGADDLNYSSPK
jgi:hypothetical protein